MWEVFPAKWRLINTRELNTHTHTHTVFVFLVSRSQPLSLICFEMNSTYSPTQRKFVDKSLSFSRQMLAGIMKSIPAWCSLCLKPLPFSGKNAWGCLCVIFLSYFSSCATRLIWDWGRDGSGFCRCEKEGKIRKCLTWWVQLEPGMSTS